MTIKIYQAYASEIIYWKQHIHKNKWNEMERLN